MARTTSTGQLADLQTSWRREIAEVWIANSVDTLVEFTADALAWSISADVNSNGRTASITLNREDSGGSLAPDMNATPPIAVNRRVEIRAVVASYSGSRTTETIFQGKIQRVSWGGADSNLVLQVRDGWGQLEDTWIETESTYGSGGGTAIATVIQSILTDAGTGLTLTTSGSPSTVIYTYTQKRQSVASAIKALADVNGWTLRFKWNGSSYVLTFSQPDRSKTVPDWTFTAADYRTLTDVARDSTRVRNRVTVQYSTGGGSVTTTDTTSTGEHGRRFMFVDASRDPQIIATGPASTLGTAMVGDLAQPLVAQTADLRFWWPLELEDLCRFPADNEFRNATADVAVVGYTHQWEAGAPAKTTMVGRGTPSGGTLRWTRIGERTQTAQQLGSGAQSIPIPAQVPEISLAPKFSTGGELTASVYGDTSIASIRILGGFTPPLATAVAAATPIAGGTLATGSVGVLASGATGGQVGYVAAYGYTATGGAGDATAFSMSSIPFGTSPGGLPSGSVGTAQLTTGAVVASKMVRAAQGFASNVLFSSSGYNNIQWGTGTIEFSDGTTQAIAAGSQTLTLGAPTTYYVYFNGTNTLQVTTGYNAAVDGDSNVIMCVAQQAASTSEGGAFYIPAVGNLRGGLNVTANQLVANSVLASKISVTSLSAISADVGTLTAGFISNATGTTFINLDATGSGIFIKGGSDFSVTAAGAATFGGTVSSNHFTASTAAYSGLIAVDSIYGYGGSGGSSAVTKGHITLTLAALNLWRPDNTTTAAIVLASGGTNTINGDTTIGGSLTVNFDAALGNAATDTISFYGAAGATQQTITGSRGGNAALASLLTALDALGIIVDSSS